MSVFLYPFLVDTIQEPKEGSFEAMTAKFELHEELSPMIHGMEMRVEMAGVIPVVPVELD